MHELTYSEWCFASSIWCCCCCRCCFLYVVFIYFFLYWYWYYSLYNVWTFEFAYRRSSVKTPAWLHYDSIHSKMTTIEMETQRNTRTRLRNISYMCILKWFIIRKKKEWFTFSLNGKFLISISLIKEQPYKMTKPTSLLSLPMFYFFVLYKQWQRNLKLTSISNLKNFLGRRGVRSVKLTQSRSMHRIGNILF